MISQHLCTIYILICFHHQFIFHQRFILIFRNMGHLVLTFYLILNFFCCDRNLCGIVQGTTDMLLWQAAVMAGTEDGYMNPYTLRSVSQSMMADSHIIELVSAVYSRKQPLLVQSKWTNKNNSISRRYCFIKQIKEAMSKIMM